MPFNNTYSFSADSELLQHYAPDVFHPKSKRMQAVYDENQNPLVFSVTQEDVPRLALTMSDLVTGKNRVFDLNKAFGITIPISNISAFQDDGQNIYLAFTVQDHSPTDGTNLYLVGATQPATWRNLDRISNALIQPAQKVSTKFNDLFFVPAANAGAFFHGSDYPLLVVRSDTQTRRVKVDGKSNAWSLDSRELPMPDLGKEAKIWDSVILSPDPFYIAVATLYSPSWSTARFFVVNYLNTVTGENPRSRESLLLPGGSSRVLKEPRKNRVWLTKSLDLKKLAVLTNQSQDKTNDLLLVGDELYHYPAKSLLPSTKIEIGAPTRILPYEPSDSFFMRDVKDVVTNQSGPNISLWVRTIAANSEETICTMMVSTNGTGGASVTQAATPIYSGGVRELCPIFHTPTQSHHFVMLLDDGKHVLLQFRPGSSVWEEVSFLISNPAANPELLAMTSTVSYHSHITVKSSEGYPLCNAKIQMTASDDVNVMVNGKSVTLAQQAAEVTTDARGCLSVVSPADSLGSTSVFRLYVGTVPVGGAIDPATNIRQRLNGINSGQALRDARVQSDDSLLLKDSDVPPETIDKAGEDLGKLHAQLLSLPADGSQSSVTTLGSFSKAWATWHFVEHKAEAVIHELKVVEGKAVAMVIMIGDEAVHFVVDTAARALKAINYVLKLLKLDLERIVDWIGFLFKWKDIKETQSDIVKVTESNFSQITKWAQDPKIVSLFVKGIDAGTDMIDVMLDEMTTGNLTTRNALGGFYEAVQQASQKQTATPENVCPPQSHAAVSAANTSPGSQWTNNQISSGGIFPLPGNSAQSSYILRPDQESFRTIGVEFVSDIKQSGLAQFESQFRRGPEKTASEDDGLNAQSIEGLARLLEPVLKDIESAFTNFAKDLANVVRSGYEKIGANVTTVIVKFAKNILKTLKDAVEIFLGAVGDVVESLVSYTLNSTIDIPFISSLWHHFTGQDPPSILEIFGILLAIPTTVIAKIAAPKGSAAWPDLSAWTSGAAYASFNLRESDPEAAFFRIKQYVTGFHTQQNTRDSNIPKTSFNGPSKDDWNNWARATICVHPTATAVEAVMQFIKSLVQKTGKGGIQDRTTKQIEVICLISEFVALSFSFPNLEKFGDEGDVLKSSSVLEITAFVVRAIDTMLTAGFSFLESKTEDKDWGFYKNLTALLCTAFECLLNLSSTVIRERQVDGVEKTANGIAIGNDFSSVIAQYSIAISDKSEDPDTQAALSLVAGIFTVADFGLDLGRGIYEWQTTKEDAEVEKNVADNYSGSHHVVTF